MNTSIPTRELIIDFEVDQVKEAIDLLRRNLSQDADGYYWNIKDSNDAFNNCVFGIIRSDFSAGLVTGTMNVNYYSVEDSKTKIVINSVARTQGVLDNSRIADIQNAFINRLASCLEGTYVPAPKVAASSSPIDSNDKYLIAFLALLAFVALVLFAVNSSASPQRRCTGSSNCTACKSCIACKHCNEGGGTCGVCSYKKGTSNYKPVKTYKKSHYKKVKSYKEISK